MKLKPGKFAAKAMSIALSLGLLAQSTPVFAKPARNEEALSHLTQTLQYINSDKPSNPSYINTGAEYVFALARGGYPANEAYYNTFCSNVESYLFTYPNNAVVVDVAHALASIGKLSPKINSFEYLKAISDFNNITEPYQASVVLKAADTIGFDFDTSAANPTTREKLISLILTSQNDDGGFYSRFSTNSDRDSTAVAIAELALYRKSNASVQSAINKALVKLQSYLNEGGDYIAMGASTLKNAIIAATSLGIDPDDTSSNTIFVDSTGKSLIGGLMALKREGGGFRTSQWAPITNAGGSLDGAIALDAYKLFLEGKMLNIMRDIPGNDNGKPRDPDVALKGPETILGASGTQFKAELWLNKWETGAKALETVISVPEGLEAVSVTASENLTGGSASFSLDASGKLRIAYINADTNEIEFCQGLLPVPALEIVFKLAQARAEGEDIALSADSFRLIESSSKPPVSYDISKSAVTIKIAKGPEKPTLTARELYVGDGVDLIPSDMKAIAVEITGKEEAIGLSLGSDQFFYAPEFSRAMTYVDLVNKSAQLSSFEDYDSYTESTGANQIAFGKASGIAGDLNAQDALAIISFWLRKTEPESPKGILISNVSADGRIDTIDALAVVERFVDQTPFAVLSK